MDTFSNETGKGCVIFVVLVVALCASITICDYHHKKNNNVIETDVELQKHNDSLRIEVDNWSAGCQVLANKEDFDRLMKLAHRQISQGYGKLFTYTLINEEDL